MNHYVKRGTTMAIILFAIFLVFRPQRWPVVFSLVIGFDIVYTVIMAAVVGAPDIRAAFLYFLYLVVTGITLASIGNAIGLWWKSRKARQVLEENSEGAASNHR